MEGPRYLKKGEFKSLTKLLNHGFPNVKPMDKTWRHLYAGLEKDFKNYLVIKDKENIISHVGLFPLYAQAGKSVIKVAGIGGVATYKKYRGHGLMRELLNYSIKIMQKENYDIAWLTGDRKRYGNYGWENGGRVHTFTVTERQIRDIKIKDFKIRKLKDEDRFLRQIKLIHEKEYFKVRRTYDDYKRLFSRMWKETYVAFLKGRVIAYVTFERDKKDSKSGKVFEYGGDKNGLKSLIKYILYKLKIERLNITCPVYHSKYKDIFIEFSSNWSINVYANSQMIKIINLNSLLKKFIVQMNAKRRRLGSKVRGNVTLKIPELNQSVTLAVNENVKIINKESKYKLALNSKDMVRLLFGLSKPSDDFNLGKEFLVLDSIFPLDFFIWPLEGV